MLDVRRWSRRALLGAVAVLCFAFPVRAGHDDDGDRPRWVGTWSASMETPLGPAPTFDHVTLRQIVHVSIGGNVVRVRFSNDQGSVPLLISSASVGLRASGAMVKTGSLRKLHFSGVDSMSIPPGGVALTDPVWLDVDTHDDLAITSYIAAPQTGTTQLSLAHQTSYVSSTGDFTGTESFPVASTNTSWFFLSGVEVVGGHHTRAVVTFGDSITEGLASTTDANARWPDVLSRRLSAHQGTRDVGVLDEAISGNRVLNDFIGPNALRRIDRDVLTQGGVRYVVLLLSTNDMGFSQLPPGAFPGVLLTNVSAAEIIAGYEQIILRVHQAGAKIYGATVLPFEGAGYYDSEVEPKRAAINQFIRTSPKFDAVIDFDAVMRDPTHPTRIRPEFDSGDHLHPNDAGYAAMGNSVDLGLFAEDD